MSKMTKQEKDQIPRASKACYYALLFLLIITAGSGLALLENFKGGDDFSTESRLIIFSVSLILSFSIIKIWDKYLYTKKDLENLIEKMGGILIRKKFFGMEVGSIWIKARLNSMWLLVKPDQSLMDFFELKGLVNFFQLGDFSNLPQIHLQMSRRLIHEPPYLKSSDPALDKAVIDAISVLKDPNLVLTLEIRKNWLRVIVKGGSCLGKGYELRILEALDFTEKLVEGLSSRFTPYDPEDWTVVWKLADKWKFRGRGGFDFEARPVKTSESLN